jgi:hypothetical protein
MEEEVLSYGTYDEEEKRADFGDSIKKRGKEIIKQSVEMYDSESSYTQKIFQYIIDIEAGIDQLLSAIDSIERRIKYKKALETTKEDLGKLNSSSNDAGREKNLKEERVKTLETDIKKIDGNLKEEIEISIDLIERKVKNYLT